MDGILDLAAGVAKRGLLAAAVILTGALVTTGAGAVAGIAAYMWLSRYLPDYLAALCVAAVLLGVGVCLLVHGAKPFRGRARRDRASGADDPIAHLAHGVVTAIRAKTAGHPAKVLMTAAALGFATGLLGRRGKT